MVFALIKLIEDTMMYPIDKGVSPATAGNKRHLLFKKDTNGTNAHLITRIKTKKVVSI
jgi:hypothetical protein